MNFSDRNRTHNHITMTLAILLSCFCLASDSYGQNAPRRLDIEEQSNVNVFRRSSPSVVNICTKAAVAIRRGESFARVKVKLASVRSVEQSGARR